jgi:hypothetical protein
MSVLSAIRLFAKFAQMAASSPFQTLVQSTATGETAGSCHSLRMQKDLGL